MATLKHHEELDAWQLANALKLRVLAILERPEVRRHRNFCDDIDRSCRSGPANLAEAFWKCRPKEKAHLVRVAIGSLGEAQNHLRDGRDGRYYVSPSSRRCGSLRSARSVPQSDGTNT